MLDKVVIDKSVANLAGLYWTNVMLKFAAEHKLINIVQIKYLNNIIDLSKILHCKCWGLKPFATLEGIEVTHIIRKRQFRKSHNRHSNNLLRSLDNCVERLA